MSATPQLASEVKAALAARGGSRTRSRRSRRSWTRYTADTYWPALAAAAAGTPIARPEIVVRPRTEQDVARCSRRRTRTARPVVPWGGGSGTQGGALPIHGGIVLDLRSLDRDPRDRRDLDDRDGAGGGERPACSRRELNARGLMLPHYPASVEWATVGGYIAARGSGVLSTRYGKIEDLLLDAARGHSGDRRSSKRWGCRGTQWAPS